MKTLWRTWFGRDVRKNCNLACISQWNAKTRRQVHRTTGRINKQPNLGSNTTNRNATVVCFLNHVLPLARLCIESILIAPDTNAVNKESRRAGRTGKNLYSSASEIMPALVYDVKKHNDKCLAQRVEPTLHTRVQSFARQRILITIDVVLPGQWNSENIVEDVVRARCERKL